MGRKNTQEAVCMISAYRGIHQERYKLTTQSSKIGYSEANELRALSSPLGY